MASFVLKVYGSLILTAVLLVSLEPIPVCAESTVVRWTAHYTTRGKLVERLLNSTGHLTDCLVYGDRRISEAALELIPRENQFLVNEENFQALVSTCFRLNPSTIHEHLRKKRQFIFPDTKWCGTGDIARGYDDLGSERDVDKCCRTHDHCPESIESGKKKYGVTNTGFFSVSSCSCDSTFRACLKAVNTIPANMVGDIFFNFLNIHCLKYAQPQICTGWWISKKCKPDYSRPQILAIVDGNLDY